MAPSNVNKFRCAQEMLKHNLVFPKEEEEEVEPQNNYHYDQDDVLVDGIDDIKYSDFFNDADLLDDYDDDDANNGFHELYWPRQGVEFVMPILFEDGMDRIECELYYAAKQNVYNSPAATPSPLGSPRSTILKPMEASSPPSPLLPRSCIRRPTRRQQGLEQSSSSTSSPTPSTSSRLRKQEPVAMRRCSFSGMPPMGFERPQLLLRSKSSEDLFDSPKVGFEEFVSVITIPTAQDYPEDVRSNIWMSRQEMHQSMRRATSGNMRRKQQQQQQQVPL